MYLRIAIVSWFFAAFVFHASHLQAQDTEIDPAKPLNDEQLMEAIRKAYMSALKPKGMVIEGPKTLTGEEVHQLLFEQGSIVLNNVVVDGNVRIIRSDTDEETLRTNNVIFTGALEISDPNLELWFNYTEFRGPVNFYLAKLHSIQFVHCRFAKEANFHSLEAQSVDLVNTVFESDAIFVNAKTGDLNLADAKFSKLVDFTGAVINSFNGPRIRSTEPILIDWSQFGQAMIKRNLQWVMASQDDPIEMISRIKQIEGILLFWKRNFEALGNELDAREARFAAIKLRRKFLLNWTDVEYWVSLILEFPNRFGTRPYRPVWLSSIVIFIFAFIYWIKNPFVWESGREVSERYRPLYGLLYSLETFVPFVDITGIKDWGCKLSERFRALEVVERLIGLLLASLTAYSIGSYIF